MRYDALLFDMDGMLVDTTEGVLKSVVYALDAFGIQVEDIRTLMPFMGPPLTYSFRTFYGFSEEDAKRAVELYRRRYHAKGQFECHVFSGVPEMLEKLLQKGYALCVATSKLESFAVSMLDRLNISKYFSVITGSNPEETISTKDEVIEESLRRMHLSDRARVLMIGDRKYDVLGAAKCGLDSFGVYMGCAESEEHEKAGATYIARGIAELENRLLLF